MPSPIWISHRGYCEDATENTAEAFRAALALGFDHLETDLRVTADGHIVLLHDPDLLRLSGQPLKVEQCRREELEDVRLVKGERLVFFDQFLSEFSDQHWIFDIKAETGIKTLNALQSWWLQPQYRDFFAQRVRFLCWRKDQQAHLLKHQPGAVCMAQLAECQRAGLACLSRLPALSGIKAGRTYALPPRFTRFNTLRPAVLNGYRARGARILAYLPETDGDAERAAEAGVDEILTNGRPV